MLCTTVLYHDKLWCDNGQVFLLMSEQISDGPSSQVMFSQLNKIHEQGCTHVLHSPMVNKMFKIDMIHKKTC